MLNRLSANVLLKSVIAVMAAVVVIMFAMNAWTAWSRVAVASRILDVADASGSASKVMHNLRIDRSGTPRALAVDGPVAADMRAYIQKPREDEMPALRTTLERIRSLDFADKAALLPELQRLETTLIALQDETWQAFSKPKAERREGLAAAHTAAEQGLLDALDKLSARLFASVKGSDPKIDQLIELKQLAWAVRNSGGDSSIQISTSLTTGKAGPDVRDKYQAALGAVAVSWAALEDMAYGTQLPPKLVAAIAAAKSNYFAAEYSTLRDHLLNAVMAGEKPDMTTLQWTQASVTRLNSLLAVAEAALEGAKQHGEDLRSDAEGDLALHLTLLAVALVLAAGSMLAVSRRVINPLRLIRDAMLKLAGGDLTAEAPFAERTDEIGALAGALGVFKQNAVEKARIEEEQRARHEQAVARQHKIEGHIAGFEGQMREALEALGGAAGDMRHTSDDLSMTSAQTNTQVATAASASDEASSNVQTVAAASEELSASISEIGRQVSHAAAIAERAVGETKQTDTTVQSLAETAAKIGEVVKLISDIASQTNLLALNATIEAARAGEAGKGFAVVASEVKSLANQTAKATEEIAAQISAVQKVTQDAVKAIKEIGGTIGEVSSVASSIALSVEQQGAATQEITRNTQAAAQRTKDVSETIGGVTAGADATGAAAQKVKSAAEALGAQAEQLRTRVNGFLAEMRAA